MRENWLSKEQLDAIEGLLYHEVPALANRANLLLRIGNQLVRGTEPAALLGAYNVLYPDDAPATKGASHEP